MPNVDVEEGLVTPLNPLESSVYARHLRNSSVAL